MYAMNVTLLLLHCLREREKEGGREKMKEREGVRELYGRKKRGRKGRGRKGGRQMKRGVEEERGRVFIVSIKQLSRFGTSFPRLWTVYFVHIAVVLCEITSA